MKIPALKIPGLKILAPLGACVLALPASLAAQAPLEGPAAVRLEAATPGARPGTTRWIVSCRHDLSLEPLRAALAARVAASEIGAMVDELDARTVSLQTDLTHLVASLGGVTVAQWWILPGTGCVVEIDAAHLDALRAHPSVTAIHADSLRAPAAFELIRDATDARNHNSDAANALGFRGQGITVAVLDSGCDENMAGSGRPHATFFVNGDPNNQSGGGIGGSRLLVNRQMGSQPADDIIAHGTAVTACAAGQVWPGPRGDAGQAPAAKIASYSMCDLPNGYALLSTMVSSWQRVVVDAATLGIKVANLSYEGSTPVEWPEQKAMDTAAHVADLAVAVMGGNGFASTHYSHGALNVLAVGSVETGNRAVSDFSSHGPMEDDRARFFPDLVANGRSLAMPWADNEIQDKIGTGTSYASANVAGAMALYRGLRPTATSLETRAAVIASTEQIGDRNLPIAEHTRNAYGLGYLRTDQLMRLGLDQATLSTIGVATAAQPVLTYAFPVVAGQWYTATIAWNRQDANNLQWSNLDLRVLMAGGVLGSGATPRNVHEKVVFKAPSTGSATIEVRAVFLEQPAVAVAVVAGASGPGYLEGAARTFGTRCGPSLVPISVPSLGQQYRAMVVASNASPSAIVLLGASDTAWGNVPLPLPLAAFGGGACTLYVRPDVFVPLPLQAGRGTLTVQVPNVVSLLGGTLFHQAAHPSTANVLGWLFTEGLRVDIAGFLP